MRHTFLFLLLIGLFSPSLCPAKSAALENVRTAQALLGPAIWSRIILIHPEHGHRGRPNRDVYALIFEFSGILWYYDFQGTQSFSRHLGDLDREKTDLLPLLRDVDPTFSRFEIVENASRSDATARPGSIVNGCFIESITALHDRLRAGERIERARLLSYYQDIYGSIVGHTVLAFETPDGAYMIDPQLGPKPTRIARTLYEDPSQVARSLLLPHLLVQARWIDAPISNAARILARADSGRVAKSETERLLR